MGILAYIASAACILAYATLHRRGGVRRYDVVNAIGAVPLVVSALMLGAVPSAIVSGFYGLVALRNLTRRA